MAGKWSCNALAGAIGAVLVVSAPAMLGGQEKFQFIVSATDAKGMPVTDLMPQEVVMTENGVANSIVKVEPFRLPVKLTLAIDNGPLSGDLFSHYRSGLTALVEKLPPDVEVTVISTAPQPRQVVRPTTERDRILRGINGFAPETDNPRFTDSLVEFSKRFEKELKDAKKVDSVPVLVSLSTTANEQVSYEIADVTKALKFLQERKTKVYVAIVSARQDVSALSQINTNRQAMIAIPATKATNGKFEALAISNRLTTLLPEWGEEIGALHRKLANQVLVTVERQKGLTGPIQNPRIELTRQGLTGQVSLDGMP